MTTLLERVQAAWTTGDPMALHRIVEQLAGQGYSRQSLEDSLEALFLSVRAAGSEDDSEEILNGVRDRLTGWCHMSNHIETLTRKDEPVG